MTQELHIKNYKKMVDQLMGLDFPKEQLKKVLMKIWNTILNDKKLTTETRDILLDYIDKFM